MSGSVSEEKKKRKDEPADCGVTPWVHERKGTARADSTKGFQCACKGKGGFSREKERKRKEKDEPGGKGAARETPHSRLHKRGLLCTCEKRGMVRVKEI